MERPRRQAAVEAIAKIQRVREWETLPESSKRFRECAAQIEAEFRAEERGQNVSADDLDADGACESDEEQSDAYSDANESFVDDDYESEDTEYHPAAEELAEDWNEEPDELQDEEDEEDEEEEDEEEAEALGDEEEEEEQPEEHQKEAEEPEEAEEDDGDRENHAILQ
jgi:hypothetical protein